MKKYLMLAVLALGGLASWGLDIEVAGIAKVPVAGDVEAFHPVFTTDGGSLLFSDEAYNGVSSVSLADGTVRLLTDMPGAAFRMALSDDGARLVVRRAHYGTQTMDLYTLDMATAAVKPVATGLQHINTVAFDNGAVMFAPAGSEAVRRVADATLPRTLAADTRQSVLLTEEDLKLVLYMPGGERRPVDPLLDTEGRDLQYCWSSLSPDGTRMLFVAGNDAYTCALDGSGLVNLGPMHAPVWRGNGMVIAMRDEDNGHYVTASDIYAVDANTGQNVRLTPRTDDIKMFPAVSPDGGRIAYHNQYGELFVITLK